jgi:hypothetical protein
MAPASGISQPRGWRSPRLRNPMSQRMAEATANRRAAAQSGVKPVSHTRIAAQVVDQMRHKRAKRSAATRGF